MSLIFSALAPHQRGPVILFPLKMTVPLARRCPGFALAAASYCWGIVLPCHCRFFALLSFDLMPRSARFLSAPCKPEYVGLFSISMLAITFLAPPFYAAVMYPLLGPGSWAGKPA